MLCVEIGCNLLTQWFSKCIITILLCSSLGKGLDPSFEQTVYFPKIQILGMFFVELSWNWLYGSGGMVLNFVNAFSLFCYYLLLGKSMVFHLIKFKFCSTQKSALCEVWPWFRRQIWISEKFTTTTKSTTTDKLW